MDTPTTGRRDSPTDWRLPLRVVRAARRARVTPWEALAWLEAFLEDFEARDAAFGDGGAYGAADGLPWPPDD